jgi:hypothetical protein
VPRRSAHCLVFRSFYKNTCLRCDTGAPPARRSVESPASFLGVRRDAVPRQIFVPSHHPGRAVSTPSVMFRRCRPSQDVELAERPQHLASVTRVVVGGPNEPRPDRQSCNRGCRLTSRAALDGGRQTQALGASRPRQRSLLTCSSRGNQQPFSLDGPRAQFIKQRNLRDRSPDKGRLTTRPYEVQ